MHSRKLQSSATHRSSLQAFLARVPPMSRQCLMNTVLKSRARILPSPIFAPRISWKPSHTTRQSATPTISSPVPIFPRLTRWSTSATDKKYLPIALEACGLSPYFDTVLSCAELGVGKDRPDVYLLALEKLGVEAKDAAVFEDSFVALETAKGIGCHTVGIFDENNFGQDRLSAASDVYIAKGQTLDAVIPHLSE